MFSSWFDPVGQCRTPKESLPKRQSESYQILLDINVDNNQMQTWTQITPGYLRGFPILAKYCATVIWTPARVEKLKALAPTRLRARMTRGLLPVVSTWTRTPVRNFCKLIRCMSGKPFAGESIVGGVFGGRPKKLMHKAMRGPPLYMTPVVRSTLTTSRPIAGRTDWNIPRQSSRPLPISLLSSGVKNALLLNVYLELGSIRMTTLRA